MQTVKAKKHLGQHFLKEKKIAARIAASLTGEGYFNLLEVGPGMGILTAELLDLGHKGLRAVEIDRESVAYLRERFAGDIEIIEGDFLRLPADIIFREKMAIIGNFPYNISSQIMFRILENRDSVREVVGMFQKEVAERICAGPGSKTYGILSVLLGAYYDPEYLFTVSEGCFNPPPKVKSGVIRLRRNERTGMAFGDEIFFRTVKAAFNQRRKTLRNSLKSAFGVGIDDSPYAALRPEQLTVEQFIDLASGLSQSDAGSE